MKHKLLKTMLLLVALVAGTSMSWADTSVVDFESALNTYTDWTFSNLTKAATDESVTAHGGSNYAKTDGTTTAYAQTSTKIESPTSITCYYTKYSTNTNNTSKFIIQISTNGSSWTNVSTGKTMNSVSKNTWEELTADLSSYSNVYVRVYYSGTQAVRCLDDITLSYSSGGGSPTCATPTFSPVAGTYTSAQSVTISTETEDATIYYTTDGSTPSTSSTTYDGAIFVSTTTTIKAIATATGYDNSSVASAPYTILPVVHAGTQEDPYTVADARNAIDANTGVSSVYVTGIVCVGGSSLSNGAMNYWISDDGTETNKFEIYKGKGIGGANFTNTDDIQVGDIVVVSGNLTKYNTTYEFAQNNQLVSLIRKSITVSPTALDFTYVQENGPDTKELTITGTGLSQTFTAIITQETEAFEMTDGINTGTALTIPAAGDLIEVSLKAGLAKGSYSGTLTLSSSELDNDVVVALTGSVTGQTYTITLNQPQNESGTIASDKETAEAGATVTLTATPAAGYDFDSWTVLDGSANEVTVTNNQFIMPASNVVVEGTFNAKPTYAITCVAAPAAGGELETSPTTAYEGQTVTLTYLPEDGYTLSSIVITKTSDDSATGITPAASGDDYTFTMPGYAVTATATFVSNTFEGSFVLYSGDLTEGDYVIMSGHQAIKNTISSNRLDAVTVTPSDDDIITNPNRSVVWHIAPSATSGYWTIYNAKVGQYAAGISDTRNQAQLLNDGTNDQSLWSLGTSNYDFLNKARAESKSYSGNKYLRYNSGYGFACYASGTGSALTLYKYTVLTQRTITFYGNGGTYNEATTYMQEVYDGVEATLGANQFTRDGYAFVGWNNQADGEGDKTYGNEDNITVSGDNLTLYAQWAPLYTLTIDNNISGGSVSVEGDITSAIEGTEITLTNTATAGYTFSAWNVYKEGDTDTKVSVTDNKFNMPAYNVVISATFAEAQTYSLITDASNIVSGKHYIIASGTNGAVKAMGNQNTNYRNVVSVTASNGIIPETDGVYEFVIYGPNSDGNYTIYDAQYNSDAGGYLYANSSSSNNMGTQASNDDNGKWSIEIANTGAATINAQGTNTRNCMRFNSDRFSCYASTTSVSALPYFYVKDSDTPVTTTASVTLNSYGYATYATTNVLDFLDADAENVGYSAWQITDANSSTGVITFGQIKETVAAGKGILLKGTPGATVNLNILPVGGATLGSNILVGTTTSVHLDTAGEAYGLSGNKFVKNSGAGDIPANRAYIPAASLSSTVKAFNFVFDDEDDPTSILTIDNGQQTTDGAIYNLAGQRMNKMQKGINIVNGKKVMK